MIRTAPCLLETSWVGRRWRKTPKTKTTFNKHMLTKSLAFPRKNGTRRKGGLHMLHQFQKIPKRYTVSAEDQTLNRSIIHVSYLGVAETVWTQRDPSENCRQRVGEISRSLEQIKVQKSAVKKRQKAKMKNFNVQFFLLLTVLHLNCRVPFPNLFFVWISRTDIQVWRCSWHDLDHCYVTHPCCRFWTLTWAISCRNIMLKWFWHVQKGMLWWTTLAKIKVYRLPGFSRSGTVFRLRLTVPILFFILAGWHHSTLAFSTKSDPSSKTQSSFKAF